MPKLASIDAQSYAALTSQSLRATIVPLQANRPLFHYVIGISGILPYKRNVTLQTFLLITRDFWRLHSTFARLYNTVASPTSHLASLGWLVGNKHDHNILSSRINNKKTCSAEFSLGGFQSRVRVIMSLSEFAACIDLIMVLEAIVINNGKANMPKNQ